MVGNNLNDVQLQQLVDRTIIKADTDFDGKISFSEFCVMSSNSTSITAEECLTKAAQNQKDVQQSNTTPLKTTSIC